MGGAWRLSGRYRRVGHQRGDWLRRPGRTRKRRGAGRHNLNPFVWLSHLQQGGRQCNHPLLRCYCDYCQYAEDNCGNGKNLLQLPNA